jgi:hypothetical protein
MKFLTEMKEADIFNLDIQEKAKLIESGAELLWEQCRLTSHLTGEKFGVVLSKSLGNLELKVNEHQKNENYELCYFLNEVIWLTLKKTKMARKDNPII